MANVPMSPASQDLCPTPGGTPVQDGRRDLEAIHGNLLEGERIDGVYRGCQDGVRLLAVTNRRLMVVEATSWEGRVALTSVPFTRVTSVCFLAAEAESVYTATAVGIKVLHTVYELGCQDQEQAREVHDLLIWNIITGP
jgi:hypothetical protein